MGDAVPGPVTGPGVQEAVYEVIVAPPSDEGAEKVRVAVPSPGCTLERAGAPGTVRGVTLLDAAEADPLPAMFLAVTVQV
jgi:hypothetical protein